MEWGARDGAAIGSWQLSARMRSGPCVFFTRRSSPGTFHFVRRAVGGFTLIELMVVVAIIAILAALVLGTLGYVNKKGAESRARSQVAALSAAIDAFKLEFGSYPPDEDTLHAELTGTGAVNTGKLLFEPTAGMVDSNTMKFIDPWGSAYEYTTNATYNVGFFDLWSTAGNAAATNAPNWIRN